MRLVRLQRVSLGDIFWLLTFGVASSWWCLTAARALSATFDEPTYLALGLEHWRTGSCRALMRLGAMPLSVDLQTLPLFLWEKFHGVAVDPVQDLPWALPSARAVTLLFWWTLLIYAWRAAYSLGGRWAARIAVALIACEPAFLAHASLANSDLPVAACLLVFLFEFRAHRESRWPWRVLLPALLYGIAMLAKASTLAFGVLGMLVIEIERLIAAGAWRDWKVHLRPFMRDAAGIVIGGLALTFIYCGSDRTTEPTFVAWAQTLAPGTLRTSMLWISEHLRIFSNAGEGLAQQIKHNIRGHPAFMLGHDYRRGVWFYFPVALTIKTTLPLLLAPLVVLLAHRRALLNWASLGAAALFVFSINCKVQIGIRFMLPLLVLLAIGVAAGLTQAYHSLGKKGRPILVALIVAGLLSNAVAAVRVWPEALCYTNPVWGGTPNGFRWLSDSNYDWGQGLLELEQWRAERGIETIDVWYFGADPRVRVAPFRAMPLHSNEWLDGRSLPDVTRGKYLAVSTTLLHGAYLRENAAGQAALAYLKTQEPIDRTDTFFIYAFRAE